MEIIDAQIHNPSPMKPFNEALSEDTQLAIGVELAREAIDSVRVDKAVVFANQPFMDAAVRRYPDLFTGVGVLDHMAEDLEEQMATYRQRPGMLGCRTLPTNYGQTRQDPATALRLNDTFLSDGFDRYWALAEKYDVPMFFSAHDFANALKVVAERHPDLTIIVDHFGITQSLRTDIQGDRFQALPGLLELARYPKVFVKCCGTPLVSREAYPYNDIWPAFHQILKAFGPERCMWASDYTRMRWGLPDDPAKPGLRPRSDWKSYADTLYYLLHTSEISQSDKVELFSGAVRRALRWPADTVALEVPA
jgi:predicted TIM-barrel fold metal-dependent hydrolase